MNELIEHENKIDAMLIGPKCEKMSKFARRQTTVATLGIKMHTVMLDSSLIAILFA
jgi:hypothetical protein